MNILKLFKRNLEKRKQEKPVEQGQNQPVSPPQSPAQPVPEKLSQSKEMPKLSRYRNLVIRGFVGKPAEFELEAIEQELGTNLPTDFVEYLRAANGGSTIYSARVPPPDGEWIGMSGLFSTRPEKHNKHSFGTFLGELNLVREAQKTPREVLPFADDGGGCIFYLDLTSEGLGRVVVFRSGLPAWTGRPAEDAFIPVAASFVEFIDSLSIEPGLARTFLEDALASHDEQEIAVLKQIFDSGLPDWRQILGKDV